MIGFFNRFLESWPARILFLVLLLSLIGWGMGDVLRGALHDPALARVAGREITAEAFESAYRRQMAQARQKLGPALPPMAAQAIGESVLDQLIDQQAISAGAVRLGLAVPDATLREAVFAMPGFKNEAGSFDRARFDAVLRANRLDEPRFLALMREDLARQALVDPIRAGAAAPLALTDAILREARETRVAELVRLPFAAAPEPPAPTEIDLRRQYENEPQVAASPEYRRIKAVILSPETIARGLAVSEAELRAAYAEQAGAAGQPERRSAQVVLAPSQATAETLLAAWRAGADWAAIGARAKAAGATAVALDGVTRAQIPSPELADAVFKAPLHALVGPVRSPGGWQVARVEAIAPAVPAKNFEQMRDQLRDQVARTKAAALIGPALSKVQDALAGGAKLEELPGDLGLAAVSGTLDRGGLTPDGTPAPLPASPPVRAALLAEAFAARAGEQPERMREAPGANGQPAAYFAVQVDAVTPAGHKPFEAVREQVRQDWLRDQRRREQERAAARLLTAAKAGTPLRAAAAAIGLQTVSSGEVPRPGRDGGRDEARGPAGIPAALARILFSLKPQEPTMVELKDGFAVAQLVAVHRPDPAADPLGARQLRDRLASAIGDDMEMAAVAALRARAHVTVNRDRLESLVRPADHEP